MAMFVLNRKHTYRSTSGVISFEKGIPVFVPPYMHKEIIAIGAEPADGAEIDLLGPEVVAKPEPSVLERKDDLFAAFQIISDRNDPKDFTGAGVPTVKAVEKIVDFDADRNEIVEAWAEYRVAKAEEGQ